MKPNSLSNVILNEGLQGLASSIDNFEEFLERYELSEQKLKNKNLRTPFETVVKIHRGAILSLQDESMVFLQKKIPIVFFRLALISSINSPSILRAIQRLTEFYNLYPNGFKYHFKVDKKSASLNIERIEDQAIKGNFFKFWAISTIHRLVCWMGKELVVPKSISFDFSAPDYLYETYFIFNGAEIIYSEDTTKITFKKADLDRKCVQNELSAAKFTKSFPFEALIPLGRVGPISRDS